MPESIASDPVASASLASRETRVIEFLQQRNAFPEGTSRVEVIETHISWVFLTDRFVYKLKKPVRFEFLDFSSVEKRREACGSELKLNRRLAQDVYLDVVPVTIDSRGRLRLGGRDRPVDWVVKMRRLPAEQALDQLLQSDRLTRTNVEKLAATLTSFYERLPPVTVHAAEYLRAMEQRVRANLDELSSSKYPFDGWFVKRIHAAQQRFMSIAKESLVDRVRNGRIVDGHGDLRPEHIYISSTAAKIIDCVEFSEELRTIDVADELAFLAMECDRLQAPWVGERICDYYCTVSGDWFAPAVIDFFKCYRACVRAKIHALRACQLPGADSDRLLATAGSYLDLAGQFASRLGPPVLLVVRGVSGTGKSTLAAALADSLGCRWLQTDKLRREIFGSSDPLAPFNTGNYTEANRRLVYDEMFRLASESLARGESVVLDGTFLSAEFRQRAIQLAHANRSVPMLIRCVCPIKLAEERIQERSDAGGAISDARPELVPLQQAQDEPDQPEWPVCTIETADGLARTLPALFSRLRAMLL